MLSRSSIYNFLLCNDNNFIVTFENIYIINSSQLICYITNILNDNCLKWILGIINTFRSGIQIDSFQKQKTTKFELAQTVPKKFQICLLNHSDTLSVSYIGHMIINTLFHTDSQCFLAIYIKIWFNLIIRIEKYNFSNQTWRSTRGKVFFYYTKYIFETIKFIWVQIE